MSTPQHNNFLQQLTSIIEEHISEEQFGVSELADAINMSRSNLLRKVKRSAHVSVSQFIREIRLRHAMELLRHSDATVSEVSFQVGFSSTSYFIKCFHDYYGYTPGEVEKLTESPDVIKSTLPHQLVAVMFTDIEGYTALMQKDEPQALAFIQRHRKIFNDNTKRYKGRILQYYGDGTLSTFHSVIDAVNCAIEMQVEFQKDPVIPVRIGLHSGDVIFNKNGIIGDGVNIASRIESLGIPGGILISEKVYDEVKNQPSIRTVSLGIFELKNVAKPIEVFAITNPGLQIPSRSEDELSQQDVAPSDNRKSSGHWWKWALVGLAVSLIIYLIGSTSFFRSGMMGSVLDSKPFHEKSIAVLPFINDSNDSSNVYIINGLMEAVLNNLQRIEDIRVISRTSVEKYRKSDLMVPEIAEELRVKYIVEGSGQKIGNRILLNIQLIHGKEDTHVWSEQYQKEIQDIFDLQSEVAEDIAQKIEVIITPEEKARIQQKPTDNLLAYDFYLQAIEYMKKGTREGLVQAIPLLKKAIDEDNKFALAFANLAISYYYLDALQEEKLYLDSINSYADLALLYDEDLAESMLAKALYYLNNKNYSLAATYLENAHLAHPQSATILNILSDFYTNYLPDQEKYLEYALKGLQLNIMDEDSTNASFTILHISNAFIQAGFAEESKEYIQKSLSYDPNNLFAEYLCAYIDFAHSKNLRKTKDMLVATLEKDPNRIDILQEIGKVCFYLRDYKEAEKYYGRYLNIKETYNLDVYPGEDMKISRVYEEVGKKELADKYREQYRDFVLNDQSIYEDLSWAVLSAAEGLKEDAIAHLKKFANQEYFTYWIVEFLPMDPLLDTIIDDPDTKASFKIIKKKFQEKHQALKKKLMEEGLI